MADAGHTDERLETLRRSDALLELRRFEEALRTLAPLLADEDGEAQCRGAQALLGLGRPEEALALATRAAAARPEDEWPLRLRSRALLRVAGSRRGRQHRELLHEACATATAAVGLAPENPLTLRSAAEVELAAGDLAAAAGFVRRAFAQDPEQSELWFLEGRLGLATENYVRAEQANRRAIALRPEYALAWNNLGVALARQGRSQEAAEALLRAAQLDPTTRPAATNVTRLGSRLWFVAAEVLFLPLLALPVGVALYVGALVVALLAGSLASPRHPSVLRYELATVNWVRRSPLAPVLTHPRVLAVLQWGPLIVVWAVLFTGSRQGGGAAVLLPLVAILLLLGLSRRIGARRTRR